MRTAKTSPKGQVVIPKEMRDRLGMKPGSLVEITLTQEGVEIRPLPENPITALRGSVPGAASLATKLMKEHRREVERDARRR
jgi:AbrB family looped-hinge helix DNA binding protein